jgi:WD40 repeat protein
LGYALNYVNLLECPKSVEVALTDTIKQKMENSSDKETNELLFILDLHSEDSVKKLFAHQVISSLKSRLLKQYRPKQFFFKKLFSQAVAFSPDGTKIITNHDNKIIVFNAINGQKLAEYVSHNRLWFVLSVAFSPDGERIVAMCGSMLGTRFIVWNTKSKVKLCDWIGHAYGLGLGVNSVEFSSDSTKIVSTGTSDENYPDNIILWNAKTCEKIAPLIGLAEKTSNAVFSPNGTEVVVGGHNKLVIWDITNTESIISVEYIIDTTSAIYLVAFNTDGDKVAFAHGNYVSLFDIGLKKELYRINLTDTYIARAVKFSPDGDFLTVSIQSDTRSEIDRGPNLIIYDSLTGNKIAELTPNLSSGTGFGCDFAWNPQGSQIITKEDNNGELILWTLFTQDDIAGFNNIYQCTLAEILLLKSTLLSGKTAAMTDIELKELPPAVQNVLQKDKTLENAARIRRIEILKKAGLLSIAKEGLFKGSDLEKSITQESIESIEKEIAPESIANRIINWLRSWLPKSLSVTH